MAKTETRHRSEDHPKTLPRNNPCAQCGAPIPIPEWVERDHGRVAYLWHCHACDYAFEAIAYFHDGGNDHALAA
jgi:ribosomal protein L37AE/L43A